VLLLLGLVGLYARQSEESGATGLVAFLVAFAGTSMILGTWWTNTFVAPTLATDAPAFLEAGPTGIMGVAYTLSFALGAVGWLLFGLVSLRTRVYPRAAAATLVVGTHLASHVSTNLPARAIAALGLAIVGGGMLVLSNADHDATYVAHLLPGLAIALAVLGFNLLGDGLRDRFDPRLADRR